MNALHTILATTALVSTIAALHTSPIAATAAADATITMTPTAFGCDITVRAHNNGNANVTIDLEDSEVKVKNGLWSKLNQGGTWVVNSGGEHESNEKYIYFPGANDFTESKSLGLADVGRHF
jgi:hypothetical protein